MASRARKRLGQAALREPAVKVDVAFDTPENQARSPRYPASAALATLNKWDGSGNRLHVAP